MFKLKPRPLVEQTFLYVSAIVAERYMYVSKILSCKSGWFEGIWSTEKTSVVTLEDEEDILDKLLYLTANPVAGQLHSISESTLLRLQSIRQREPPVSCFLAQAE